MQLPNFSDVLHARQTISPYLMPTPLYHYPGLSNMLGAELWIKHENHQPIRAFKIRGAVNFMANINRQIKARGVITASTGNHGQGIAYAAKLFGVQATVAMPSGANSAKMRAITDLGAEIKTIGEDFDDCRKHIEANSNPSGPYYLSSGDAPSLITGAGTYALEIIETLPNVDVIIVPVGGGSGAAGTCLVASTLNPSIRVIGVQSDAAPSAYLSWQSSKPVTSQSRTFAEGLATSTPFDLPQAIMRQHLDDFILVSEDDLKEAIILAVEQTHNLCEAAGAASLAAACKIHETLRGKRVVLIMSGGNITLPQLKSAMDTHRDTTNVATGMLSNRKTAHNHI